MKSTTLPVELAFAVLSCGDCATPYAVPSHLLRHLPAPTRCPWCRPDPTLSRPPFLNRKPRPGRQSRLRVDLGIEALPLLRELAESTARVSRAKESLATLLRVDVETIEELWGDGVADLDLEAAREFVDHLA